jgi:hypothetical protein
MSRIIAKNEDRKNLWGSHRAGGDDPMALNRRRQGGQIVTRTNGFQPAIEILYMARRWVQIPGRTSHAGAERP